MYFAGVVELVDTIDSKSIDFLNRESSSLSLGIVFYDRKFMVFRIKV